MNLGAPRDLLVNVSPIDKSLQSLTIFWIFTQSLLFVSSAVMSLM